MKKLLVGLLIASLAFLSGILGVEIAHLREQKVLIPNIENLEYERFENQEIPFFEIGQLENTEKVETIDNSRDIYAWYALDDYGKMSEVSMIKFYLTDYTDDGVKSERPILYAGVYTTLSEDVYEGFAESAWASFENGKLKFKTKKLKGIEYRFEGVFFKDQKTGTQGEKLLRGTLQKFVKGKKVAQISGDFAFYAPYCLS